MLQPLKTTEPIPGYVVKERIGVGGYGEVWRVEAPGGLSKAIKFVYGYFDDERAARELKALNRIKQVRHPFLLSLERFEIVDGQLIIVTELANMSLKDRFDQITEPGPIRIPRAELLGYLRDAADALDYMSENFSLQHLDVKPENLLLVGGRVKVADFGLVKDLQDVTASMMGGLTPVYAPPEVFDGRPSQHSDQYSLAIVYQEMLTGILPFPGRTPAQLASQHVHARPRLTPLPQSDQPVIARALSKDPEQRFPNCRALIDSLLAADRAGHGDPAAPDRSKTAEIDAARDTTSLKLQAAKTDTDSRRLHGQPQVVVDSPSPNVMTQVIGGEAADARPVAQSAPEVMPPAAPIKTLVDLPPIDVSSIEMGLRPTLFLGIGGTASQTLRRLRRRLSDRLGPSVSVPAIQMLLLDTDARNIYQATQGNRESALSDKETISLPLRNAHDYTADARNILQWLSRRWLYNIPRSLQTEGRRPLGRLALVDHAQQVLERLREALADITSPAAITASTLATGLGFRSQTPRVFLLSSISGGTGGGMVLDVAYAVRQILADLGCSDDGVCGILTHSTDRNPAASDLAIANAYACLTELQHYSGPSYYPGEPAFGLPAFKGNEGTFPNAYFVHMGDDLNDDEFEKATDALASYLYLDTMTPAGTVFDKWRESTPASTPERAGETSLRSFGLACIGSSQSTLPTMATEFLCKAVVDHWRGARHDVQDESGPASLIEIATHQRGAEFSPTQMTEVEAMAADHARQLELDIQPLHEHIQRLLENELGGDADAVFAKLLAGVDQHHEHVASGRSVVAQQLFSTINSLFGQSSSALDWKKPTSVPLRLGLERQLKSLSGPKGDTLRDWILELTENPTVRFGGAWSAKEWFAGHLCGLQAKCTELLRETQHQLPALEQALLGSEEAAPARGKVFGSRRPANPHPEVEVAILQLIRLRFQETSLLGLGKILLGISAQVSVAGDQLKELQRELGRLSREFAAASPWDDTDRKTGQSKVVGEVWSMAAGNLRLRILELARKVDERFQTTFLQQQGGLRNVCQKADAMRSTIPAALRAAARAEVVSALKEISIASVVLDAGLTDEQQAERLRACVDAARPRLTDCGGSQHLLAIVPTNSAGSALQEAVSHLDPPATLVSDSDADLVFCYEVQELSLSNVAARLIENRSDFVQISARLHTRMDVAWSGLGHTGGRT
jgi:serine/threonine protein kinase